MPFRNTFKGKIKCLVSVAVTQKAISQRHAELDDTEWSDSSTIDTHLEAKAIYCLVIFSRSKYALLSSSCYLVRDAKFSYFLCMCIKMMNAREESKTDRVSTDQFFFSCDSFHWELGIFSSYRYCKSSDWSCRTTLNTFGGNTFGITFGSFSPLRLISSSCYTVLDILLWKKKFHKGEL